MVAKKRTQDVHVIKEWLVAKLAEALKTEADQIDIRENFTSYGIRSSTALSITGELGELLRCDLPATLFYDYPNIEALAVHLVEESHETGKTVRAEA